MFFDSVYDCGLNWLTFVNGPEPTGFGFVNFSTSTFDQIFFGTIQTFESCDPTNVESGALKRIVDLVLARRP